MGTESGLGTESGKLTRDVCEIAAMILNKKTYVTF